MGARLHRLRAFGHDLLRTHADPEMHLREPFFWGAYVMAPWCNRIATRPVEVGGRVVILPPNFRDGTAIHGQVYAVSWSVDSRTPIAKRASAEGVRMSVAGGGDAWPWRYEVDMQLMVAGGDLRVELRVSNLSDAQMPAGVGLHPWFVGRPEVAINADSVFDSNSDSPAEPRRVSGDLDRRTRRAMPPNLDATWTRLGTPAVTLGWPALGIEADMSVDAPSAYVCAASPTDIEAVAVEPQTHGPDGLRRLIKNEPGGLSLLEPGGVLTMAMTLSFTRTEEDRQ